MWHLSDTATFEPNCKRVFSGASRTSCLAHFIRGCAKLLQWIIGLLISVVKQNVQVNRS